MASEGGGLHHALTWAFRIFVALFAVALLLYLVGTYGWFGQPKDPLSGVFLIPLGLPWTLLLDRLTGGDGSPAVGLAGPVINAAILWMLARGTARRGRAAS